MRPGIRAAQGNIALALEQRDLAREARWVTPTNLPMSALFFFRKSSLTMTELPYGLRPTSRQATNPMSSPSSFWKM